MDEDKPTKSRVITRTFKYCNSGREEEKTITCLFTERSEKFLRGNAMPTAASYALVDKNWTSP